MTTKAGTGRFAAITPLALMTCMLAVSGWSEAAEKPGQPAPSPTPSAAPAQPAEARFPALEALEREVARLVETARPSVVGVIARSRVADLLDPLGERIRIEEGFEDRSRGPMARRVGSGVVIDSRGHVVTLASVVSGALEISIVSSTGRRLPAQLRGLDDESGIAVLVLDEPGSLQPLRFGDSDTLKPGAVITTFASGMGDADGAPAYSLGFVSGTGVSLGPLHRGSYLKLNAHAAPGAGGGPVLDAQGRLTGIVFAGGGDTAPDSGAIRWTEKAPRRPRRTPPTPAPAPPATPPAPVEPEDPEDVTVPPDISVRILRALHRSWADGSGVSYAVPGNVVRRVSDEIIKSGSVRRGWVGVRIEEEEPGEIELLSVVPGSPADAAGLRTGDRIVSYGIGSRKLETLASSGVLVEQIASSAPGETLRLGILRLGEAKTVTLVMGEAPQVARRYPDLTGLAHLHGSLMRTPRPALGVEIDQEVDEEQLKLLGSPEGLLIAKVHDHTRAQEAGMQPGDLLVEALGVRLTSLEALRKVLAEQGDRLMPVKIVRDRREMTLTVAPIPKPPLPPAAPAPPAPRRKRG